jgi:SAM-dependent methyltransferase
VVVDLCCGSGAVGAALLAALGRLDLCAVDIDPAAVRCARRNLAGTGARVYHGDLYQPLPADLRGRVDLLVANAPYVPSHAVGTLPPEARLHEPLVRAGRRRRGAGRPAPGHRGGAPVAGSRRPAAGRGERGAGPGAGRERRRRRSDAAGHYGSRTGGHRGHRNTIVGVTYLNTPAESPLYAAEEAALGYVPNYTRAFALRPRRTPRGTAQRRRARRDGPAPRTSW